MPADNTTAAVTHTVISPGTSFSIDVTNANLNDNDDTLDFDIYHDDTHQPNRLGYTKSSNGSTIDYSGSSLTGVVVTVRRHTSPSDVLFFENVSLLSAARLDTMLNRCWRIIEELETFITKANAFVISDTAYGVSWIGESEAASKNTLYDEIELRATLASPTFSGTVTVPTTITAAEQLASKSYADNTATTLINTTGVRVNTEPAEDDSSTTLVSGEWYSNTYGHESNIENESGLQTTDTNGDDKWQQAGNVFDFTVDADNGGIWLFGFSPYYDVVLDRTTDETVTRTDDLLASSFIKIDDGSDQIAIGNTQDHYPAFLWFYEESTGSVTFDVELYQASTHTDELVMHGSVLFRVR